MDIQLIDNKNLNDVTKLVTDVFMEFEAPDYSDEGVTVFFDTVINNQDFMSNLVIYGAYMDKHLAGIIATRNSGNHIALFFVDGLYHRRGIGRKLFEMVLQSSTSNEITVNSSPYAKGIYHHLGFEDTDTEQSITGIRFIPMRYSKRA